MTLKQKMIELHMAHPDWTVTHMALALNKRPEIIRVMRNEYAIPIPRTSAAESKRIRRAHFTH